LCTSVPKNNSLARWHGQIWIIVANNIVDDANWQNRLARRTSHQWPLRLWGPSAPYESP
jgi:hypothetical protein